MRIIITEEKSSNVMSKFHNLKKIASELAECFEECKEESSRNRRYDDEDEYDKYSSKHKNRKDYDDEDYDDYDDDYKHSSRHSFQRSRY